MALFSLLSLLFSCAVRSPEEAISDQKKVLGDLKRLANTNANSFLETDDLDTDYFKNEFLPMHRAGLQTAGYSLDNSEKLRDELQQMYLKIQYGLSLGQYSTVRTQYKVSTADTDKLVSSIWEYEKQVSLDTVDSLCGDATSIYKNSNKTFEQNKMDLIADAILWEDLDLMQRSGAIVAEGEQDSIELALKALREGQLVVFPEESNKGLAAASFSPPEKEGDAATIGLNLGSILNSPFLGDLLADSVVHEADHAVLWFQEKQASSLEQEKRAFFRAALFAVRREGYDKVVFRENSQLDAAEKKGEAAVLSIKKQSLDQFPSPETTDYYKLAPKVVLAKIFLKILDQTKQLKNESCSVGLLAAQWAKAYLARDTVQTARLEEQVSSGLKFEYNLSAVSGAYMNVMKLSDAQAETFTDKGKVAAYFEKRKFEIETEFNQAIKDSRRGEDVLKLEYEKTIIRAIQQALSGQTEKTEKTISSLMQTAKTNPMPDDYLKQ